MNELVRRELMTVVVTGVVMVTDSSHSNAPGEKANVGIPQMVEDSKGKDGKVTSPLTLRYVRNTLACIV